MLLDLNMPEMNGFEVLKRVKEDENLCHIPIVIMSTTESNEIIADTLKMGAINFIVKPVRIQQCKALAGFMKSKN